MGKGKGKPRRDPKRSRNTVVKNTTGDLLKAFLDVCYPCEAEGFSLARPRGVTRFVYFRDKASEVFGSWFLG